MCVYFIRVSFLQVDGSAAAWTTGGQLCDASIERLSCDGAGKVRLSAPATFDFLQPGGTNTFLIQWKRLRAEHTTVVSSCRTCRTLVSLQQSCLNGRNMHHVPIVKTIAGSFEDGMF
jgi:hypothetical protein